MLPLTQPHITVEESFRNTLFCSDHSLLENSADKKRPLSTVLHVY